MNENRVSRRGSSHVVLISVISGLLMCTVALLIWISLVKTSDLTSGTSTQGPIYTSKTDISNDTNTSEVSSSTSTTTVASESVAAEETSEVESATTEEVASPSVSLDIDEAITKVQGTTDYLSASDYSVQSSEDSSNVVKIGRAHV